MNNGDDVNSAAAHSTLVSAALAKEAKNFDVMTFSSGDSHLLALPNSFLCSHSSVKYFL